MAIPTLIRANGKMFTRNSCAVRINGVYRLTGIDSIEWSDERPTELVPGMNDGGPPIGKAQGNYGCAGSISVYADESSQFEQAIFVGPSLPSDPTDLSSATFQISVIMREDFRTKVVVLVNCNVKGRPSRTVGNDGNAIVMQYELQPLMVLEDGKSLVTLIPAL
jgi:hypothetical protein